MQLVFDRNWFMVAETADGETAAIAITVPDVNQVLKKMNGRLLPLGWWHYLRKAKTIDRVRVGFLGVKPEYQHTGVGGGALRRALRHRDARAAEVGRDGLDPRDQPQHEPRDGGDGRAGRAAFSGVRAAIFEVRAPSYVGFGHGSLGVPEGLPADVQVGAAGPLHPRPSPRPGRDLPAGDRAAVRRPASAASGCRPRSATRSAATRFWTLAEYWIHRVIFHFEPEQGVGARLHWMVHGVHHDHPNDPLRLVMPPAASVPLALVFYGAVLARAGRRSGVRVRRGLPRRLSGLRHDPLPPAPPHAATRLGQLAAGAAHAPPLPGRRARLRHQRAVLGSRVRHHAPSAGGGRVVSSWS